MKLLALDPAANTGFAFGCTDLERPEQWGAWQIARGPAEHPGRRLERLRERIYAARRAWGVERIAFEESSFGSPNPEVKALHNELRGVIKLCACELGIPVTPANIATVKKFACHGRAKKGEMIAACERHFGVRAASSDEADAIWIWAWAKAHPNGKAPSSKPNRKPAAKRASGKGQGRSLFNRK